MTEACSSLGKNKSGYKLLTNSYSNLYSSFPCLPLKPVACKRMRASLRVIRLLYSQFV
jgi:hypothetical protein